MTEPTRSESYWRTEAEILRSENMQLRRVGLEWRNWAIWWASLALFSWVSCMVEIWRHLHAAH